MQFRSTYASTPLKLLWSDVFKGISKSLKTAQHRYQVFTERRELRKLDQERLKDIGVTRDQALREAERKFWDV